MTEKVVVNTSPATSSKINWTQIGGIVASIAAFFGLKDLDPTQIAAVIMGIQAAQSLVTIVIKTFFSKTITTQSAEALPESHRNA